MIMETNYIIGFVCMLLAWATSFIFGVKIAMVENKKQGKQILLYGLLTFILIGTYMKALSWNNYRDGQIDALKGKYNYRMEINYDQHGTPKDTIYVKEEWRKNMEKDTVVIIPIRTVRDTVIYINR